MAVALYFDVHVPVAIAEQLRQRGVDVLTAQEDNAITLTDERLLERATALQRVLFTQDLLFKRLAEDWLRAGRNFSGLVYAHQMRAAIGQLVATSS